MISSVASLVALVVFICAFKKKGRAYRIGANIFAFLILIYGFISFSSMIWSATVPNDYEWPMGFPTYSIKLPDGRKVAVSEAHGRIQIYDYNYTFLNGFSVDAGGGVFKIRKAENNTLEIQTARGNKRIVYDLDGNVISKERLQANSYSKFSGSGGTGFVPTPIYLLPFTSPALAWCIGALGGGLLIALNVDVKKMIA